VVRLLVPLVGLLFVLASPAQADVFEGGALEAGAVLAAADVPDDFVEETAFDDLVAPASIAFADDGRVFVAQLDGVIKVFDGLEDATASVYADLSTNVAWHNDRGLMGMVLDPQFTTGRPYMYVAYTYDAAIGGTAPRWNDNCTDPPGAERDGCVVSGRLSKIMPDGSEVPLITDDWCQQYPSHSLGDLQFGPDGALYVSSGDGASYTFADYGQDGSPRNPCGDHPQPVGGAQTPPTAEGGSLRSQDPFTTSDPTGLDGTIIRVDPDTGDPLPTNPGTGDVNARRIVAYGLRNPFRFAFRPGTADVYVGDVGWLNWEELNRVPDITSQVRNYGWPCHEGGGRQSAYESLGLNICNNLYAAGTALPPLYTYNHAAKVATEDCPVGSSSISGVEFYQGGTFPPAYQGAMFFADYSRNCIWVMFPGPDGTPNPATRQVFVDGAGSPVDLEMGPAGDLYYADVGGGMIRRIRAINPNQAPIAAFTATPAAGNPPLAVQFDGTGSSDPNNDELQYAWDLDGDGAFDDSTAATPTRTYTQDGHVTARLRVTDPGGLADTEQREITVGTPPTPEITGPTGATRYAVGDAVPFAGTARRDGVELPASQLRWTVDLNHCSAIVPSSCHVHHIQDFVGVKTGSFAYPDHEYPSHLTLSLTATSASGLHATTSVRLDPKTVELTFDSEPSGLRLAVGGEASTTPFTRSVAENSTVGVAAPPNQLLDGFSYDFSSWSDGGAAAHQFTAPSAASTFTATYEEAACPVLPGLVGAWGFDEPSGSAVFDTSGRGNGGAITGAARTTDGRVGSALSFDGIDDLVTVADANSIDLVSGMTLEAWVNPTALGSSWRTVLLKEQPGNLAYALYANDGEGRPTGHVAVPLDSRATGSPLPQNAWSHLAATYDGSSVRLYVDGAEVASNLVFGSITVSSGALRIGGNTVWGEWFAGRIDEVRVYDRPLSAAEIGADMTRPIICAGEPGAPVLAVTPASLSFSGREGDPSPATKTLEIANGGEGSLDWTAADDAPWLSVSPGGGSGAGSLTVTPDTSGLDAGTHSANVTISAAGASGSPRVVPVTLTVDPRPPGPALAIAPGTLAFTGTEGGASPPVRTLAVSNSGGGTMDWTASDDAPWLSVAPASGTNGGDITVSASIDGLDAGSHTATITVSAPGASGSPRTVPVTFTVEEPPQPPALAVSPAALSFSATQGAPTVASKAFTVTNAGGGTLEFTAAANVPWLTVSPGSDTAPRTVSVTPSTAGLAPGVHTATVTVDAPGATGSPRTVDVTFTVSEAPACPAPAGLVGAWGFDETSGTIVADASPAANAGTITGATRTTTGRFGGALTFDGSDDWVTVDDASSLRLTTGMTASAWVNPTELGSEWRTVLFKQRSGGISYSLYGHTDSGQPSGHVSTPFEVNARAPSGLGVGVWSHLATSYDGTTLRLFVNGVQVAGRAVSGAIANDAGPLRFGGNAVWDEWFAGRIDEVRLYNRALSATELQADMANPVTCSAQPVPSLSVTPASLSFTAVSGGSSPAAKTLDVANAGGGSMGWTASENLPWLSLTPTSGTNAGTVTVTPTTTGLAQGTYTGDVTVTAPGAAGSPRTIEVTLTVGPPPPVLALTPASLSFSGSQGGSSPAAKTIDVSNTGDGTLTWTASETVPWLSVAPASGTGAGTITVTPSLAGLTAGTYSSDVTVTAAGATGSPRVVPVTLTVAPPPPALAVSPSSLAFTATEGGPNPAARDVSVTNAGGGALNWAASDDAPWLTVTPGSGSAPATLSVAPSIAGLAPGTHTATVTVTAAGVSGSPKTIGVTLTVTAQPATPPGLVAAYGFDEASGAGVVDGSGNGLNGTLTGATRSTGGRFGSALSFDGVNDWVTVPDANALDLTTGLTMSAWVNPTAIGSIYRTVLMKEQPGGLIYTLYAGEGTGKPSAHIFTTSEQRASGPTNTAPNTWTHLASTWDGTTLRTYVDGIQVGTRAVGGTLRTSTGVLRIGGTGVWAEWFAGRIDEVRIYNRALTGAELQGDMTRGVAGTG
jgi:glucose/arabinose dehydrogenase/PKD repeat protein